MSIEKALPREKNPDYIYNPKTGRYIKKSGKTYQQLLLDSVVGLDPDDRKNNIIATGTPEELTSLQTKLKDSPVITAEGKELAIRGNKLCVVRKKVDKRAIRDKIKTTQQDVAIENRAILKSDLSDDQVKFLLGKICDMKLMGKTIDVQAEVNQLLGIMKPTRKKKRRSRFRALPPPDTDYESSV
jgi:hypothetical protein